MATVNAFFLVSAILLIFTGFIDAAVKKKEVKKNVKFVLYI